MTRLELIKYFEEHETTLMEKILHYAKEQGYTKYTSTLIEAWRVSIQGLTESFRKAYENALKLGFEVDVIPHNALTEFGTKEALLHRDRGVTLEMFLSLTKYYRQAYLDVIMESDISAGYQMTYVNEMVMMFDQIEVSFIYEWNKNKRSELEDQLKENTRLAINEKNRYLTIFESVPTPLIILDMNYGLSNMNFSAQEFFDEVKKPGRYYYNEDFSVMDEINHIKFETFLNVDFDAFNELHAVELPFKNEIEGQKLSGTVMKILDVSRKTTGYLVAFDNNGDNH